MKWRTDRKIMKHSSEKHLAQHGIHPTAMRLLVLEYLLDNRTAASLGQLEREFYRSDKATLYRTLKTFEKKGLIHGVNVGGTTVYLLCRENCSEEGHFDVHPHFFCTVCAKTICLPQTKMPRFDLPEGFDLHEINLILKGRCDECAD